MIACIEDQDIIDRILAHLREKEQEAPARRVLVPPTRAAPAKLSLLATWALSSVPTCSVFLSAGVSATLHPSKNHAVAHDRTLRGQHRDTKLGSIDSRRQGI